MHKEIKTQSYVEHETAKTALPLLLFFTLCTDRCSQITFLIDYLATATRPL